MSSSSTPLTPPAQPSLQDLLAPKQAAAAVPSAEELGERIMNTAHRMRAMVLHNPNAIVSSGNRFEPQVESMSPDLPFKAALETKDLETPGLPAPLDAKVTVQAQLQGIMKQTVSDLTQGMPFDAVEANWKLTIEDLKGKTADKYNAQIDANPTNTGLAGERDAALAALDKLQDTKPGSTFHTGLDRLDKALTSQKNLNHLAILEKTASKGKPARTFTMVLSLEKTQEQIEKDVSQTKNEMEKDAWNKLKEQQKRQASIDGTDADDLNDITAGVKDPAEIKESGIYKVTGEHQDLNKTGIHLTYNKDADGKVKEVLGRPFPDVRAVDSREAGCADFTSSWEKVLDGLAAEGNTIELHGANGRNLVALIGIMTAQHKDRYIELTDRALSAISSLGTAEAFQALKDMKAHNEALQKTKSELLQVAISDIQSKVVKDKLVAVQTLKGNVNDGMIARIDTLNDALKAFDVAPAPSPERRVVLIERLVTEIEKQSKELEGKSDVDLADPKMADRITAISDARETVDRLVQAIRTEQAVPVGTANAPAETKPPIMSEATWADELEKIKTSGATPEAIKEAELKREIDVAAAQAGETVKLSGNDDMQTVFIKLGELFDNHKDRYIELADRAKDLVEADPDLSRKVQEHNASLRAKPAELAAKSILDTKLTDVSGRCEAVKDKMDATAKKAEAAVKANPPAPSGPASP
jgi:hypothetical protein